MSSFDDLEIKCPRMPQTTAQSLNLNTHGLLRRSTELAHYNNEHSHFLNQDDNLLKSDQSRDDSMELHKSGPLKPLLTKKTTGRSKKKVAKGYRQQERDRVQLKNLEQRSTQFTKRKPSGSKKLSSVSNDKDLTIDLEERLKLLKHQLKIKEEEVSFFRRHIDNIEKLAEGAKKRAETIGFESIEAFATYLKSEMDKQTATVLPAVMKLVHVALSLVEQAASSEKCGPKRFCVQSLLSTASANPREILQKDIDSLQARLQFLKVQNKKMEKNTPVPSKLIFRLREKADQQSEQLASIHLMEEEMESNRLRRCNR